MATLSHSVAFLAAAAIVWFFAGILIEAVVRVAKRFHKSGFGVAFFVLGMLTSISEISVAVNATLGGVPQVSAGNLIGASFVLLLFAVPFLGAVGNGISLKHAISHSNILLTLAAIALPALFIVDGEASQGDGMLLLLAYGALAYAIHRGRTVPEKTAEIPRHLLGARAAVLDALKILLGGGAIFLASHFLVEQTVYLAGILHVPSALIGLLLLSIGTNVPELVIAVRSVLNRHTDIAFGDYLGSAVANTPIFGALALFNGGFRVEAETFFATTALMAAGLTLLYFFAVSKNKISRQESILLLLFYAAFLIAQFMYMARFTTN